MIRRGFITQARLATETLERHAQRLRRQGIGSGSLGRLFIDTLLYPRDVRTVVREYFRIFRRHPSLFRPQTFNEKIQQAKLFGRRRRRTVIADKLAVRDLVKQRIGSKVVIPKIYWIGTNLAEASQQVLPDRFVIKSNHASGQVMIVHDARAFDWSKATMTTREWLECDWDMWAAEWQYRWIPRRLFVEEYIGAAERSLIDYKFFCFHGRTELIQVDIDRYSNHTRAMFDRDFHRLAIEFCDPNYGGTLVRPCSFEHMRAAAELLAQDESFVRVDLYDAEVPIFGELSLTPEAGLGKFDPPEWDRRLGQLW
jgi:TupA-like ATPgrasp